MVRTISKIAVAAFALMALAVFVPRANASPVANLFLACNQTSNCGTITMNANGFDISASLNMGMTGAQPALGEEVGESFTVSFDTYAGTISIMDSDDGDLNFLNGVITAYDPCLNCALNGGESLFTIDFMFNNGTVTGTGSATFLVSGNFTSGGVSTGNVETSSLSIVTPEPASLLLMGTGLLGLGGAIRRRWLS